MAYQAVIRRYFPTTTRQTHKIQSFGLFWNTKGIGYGLIGSINGKFGDFPQTKPYLTRRKHLMGLFLNTRGIGTGVIESLSNKLDAFPSKKHF
jgi:hypothetical protein